MTRIAVATVAVSVAVMLAAMAVIAGFRSEITGKIVAFTGHIRVVERIEGAPIRVSDSLARAIRAVEGVRSAAPYALAMGIVKTPDATQGVMLKGVGGDYDLHNFADWLVEGELPRVADSVRHKDVLISASVARMLRLSVDDRVEMLFVEGSAPRRDRFRVSGLFDSGFGELDERFAITDIASVCRLNGWESTQATGYEVVTTGGVDDLDNVAERVAVGLRGVAGASEMGVGTVVRDFPQHFDWLATHDVNAAVIIAIMIVVALISMISALLIIVLERIRMIGILKTLGMRNGDLRRIFVARAAAIVLRGLIIGNIVGLGLIFAQARWGLLTLDSEGYFISRVPVEVQWGWVLGLNAGSAAILILFMVLPTAIVARVEPEKTVRYV